MPVSKEDPKEDLVKYFITSTLQVTKDVLTTFCGLNVTLLKPIVREKNETVSGITAIIGLISPQIVGTIAVSFDKDCYMKTMSRMLGENYESSTDQIPDDVADGSAEVVNQLFGNLKQKCNGKGVFFSMTMPSIIRGSQYYVFHKGTKSPFCVPMKTEFGLILLEVVADFNV